MTVRGMMAVALAAAALLAAPQVLGQQPAHPTEQRAKPPPDFRRVPPPPGMMPTGSSPQPGRMPPPPGALRQPRQPSMPMPTGPLAPHPLHASEGGHGEGEHGAHDAAPKPINWWHGFLGKKEGVEPNLLWRSPEEDAPFLAALLNFAVFAWVIVRFGKKPLQESLSKRKTGILKDIETAQKMRQEAEERLKQYEDRLEHINEEIERIRKDFREQGERDKERIQKEAEEKRDRMLKDASFLIEQESKELRVTLLRETVDAAVQAAEQVLRSRITDQDHDRLAEQFLKQIAASKGAATSKGGSA